MLPTDVSLVFYFSLFKVRKLSMTGQNVWSDIKINNEVFMTFVGCFYSIFLDVFLHGRGNGKMDTSMLLVI